MAFDEGAACHCRLIADAFVGFVTCSHLCSCLGPLAQRLCGRVVTSAPQV